jgi:hypothetical protein
MILNCIDSPASKYYHDNNREAIFYNLLIADYVRVTVDAAWSDMILTDIDTWKDDKIITTFTKLSKKHNHENAKRVIEQFIKLTGLLKKIRHVKNKNREMTAIISSYNKHLKQFKSGMQKFKNEFIEYNHVNEMMPFIDEGIWQMMPIDYEPGPNKEDSLIQPIVNTFLEPENILSIDGQFVALFNPATYFSTPFNDSELIMIPLWNFPHFTDINYQQIKYTRDNLQPGLKKFKEQLKEISDLLSQICFSSENFQQIRQLFDNRFFETIEQVQKLTDESLYINKMKNQFKENTGFRFCLGVTSVEAVVRSFERTETIQPYVANEIKHRIAREIDLKSGYVFTFLEAIETNPLPSS